jgi:type I restriction enzyme M protein
VSAEDEWCAEAYMETDYTSITQSDFEKAVREHALFTLSLMQEGADLANGEER